MTSRITTLMGALAAGTVLVALGTRDGAPPQSTPAAFCGNYTPSQITGSIVPGTTDVGNHCDDCATAISLPFAYNFYGTSFQRATVSSNGTLQFSSAYGGNGIFCVPDAGRTLDSIYVFNEDLTTNVVAGDGIYTSVSGTSPNRIFNIEWRTHPYGNTKSGANFEIRLYEALPQFDLVYGSSPDAGATSGGLGAQQKDGLAPNLYVSIGCRSGQQKNGVVFRFTAPLCDSNTPTPTPTKAPSTATPTPTPTSALATATPTRTPTRTPTPPPATATPTSTPTPVATPTPTPLPAAPSVTTKPASQTLATTAILNAQVSPNGMATSAWFELGRTTSYGVSSQPQDIGSATGNVNISTEATGLACGLYHYRAAAHNSAGTTFGNDVSFTTVACPSGDENGDSQVNTNDVFYLVNFLFSGGPAPVYPAGADVNNDGNVDVQDAFYLLNYLFAGGPAPK